eukprot:CAMPEP_0175848636 /NCGR_PEP_ID=MMETSP0107_2-20121207/24044_1 /TAXON_ID=195067 ORGANISM="Goniomonas pacifica, Strain CCMP1869" /NCGR_SAMPLE_ID=MMETSP0107_2 /ASSEMBLY_ACC=CAM_ASM_000203 /LENGTH=91 /DNA_ID=CAMNT_0017163635 /DNA_START=221 /DNA_END=494 /DNA_ORIENTATION=+
MTIETVATVTAVTGAPRNPVDERESRVTARVVLKPAAMLGERFAQKHNAKDLLQGAECTSTAAGRRASASREFSSFTVRRGADTPTRLLAN